jgi:hypothetical protein
LLVIAAFVSAYFNVEHEYRVAALLVVALGFFTAALVNFSSRNSHHSSLADDTFCANQAG